MIPRKLHRRKKCAQPCAYLVGNWCQSIPTDAEIPQDQIEPIIAKALEDAETQGVSAKAVTPFLLQRIFELTDGRSLDSNIALVLNNARLAAEIGVPWANDHCHETHCCLC